jgi:hypothetical protein
VTWQGLSLNQARRDAASQFPSHEYQALLMLLPSFGFSIRSDPVPSPRYSKTSDYSAAEY